LRRGTSKRSEVLEGANLHYAPENELGVVYLFAHLAKRLRLKVDWIGSRFPDCIAYQKTDRGEKEIRIEFEYRSRNFKGHHPHHKCDWIVCWEHNWPDMPKRLTIVELRKYFGLGFNVWIQSAASPYKERLRRWRTVRWSINRRASKGDLVLFYDVGSPDRCIRQIFVLADSVQYVKIPQKRREGKHWKGETDYEALMRVVCRLKAPLFLDDLKGDRILGTAGFVRAQMIGRPNATEYWPYLYDRIVRRNPSAKRSLAKYAPDALTWLKPAR
jgi:hypothetical protein